MKEKIEQIKNSFTLLIKDVSNLTDLEKVEIKFLGRKSGELTAILRGLKNLPQSLRQEVGPLANSLRQEIELEIKKTRQSLQASSPQDSLDVTVPGQALPEGNLHLVTSAINEIVDIFERVGFVRRRYPEVDWDWYAFESLNMAPDHPARDEWETFFIDQQPTSKKGQRVLTPHTSSGQVREMERKDLPIRMINISKCYRRQSDVSHVPMFHQFEGMCIDEHITIAHLKGAWQYFVQEFFGVDRKIRTRPFHFSFTEPSMELDVSCGVCGGSGYLSAGQACKMCKEGWLELGGGGMIHPNVLKAGKIDPKKYSGFAFGWGVERCYLMKAGLAIPDIRMMYQNDLRFLKQF